jgi:disulfide bond formation protein DsbB
VPSDLSRLLNALGLVAVDTLLALAFIDQLWFRDLPCPVCILQRGAFIAAGFGIALNLLLGPRPSHYGMTILGAIAGGAIALRQILLYIVPGSGSYGNEVLGMHLYSWAFVGFVMIVVGAALALFYDRQFGRGEPLSSRLDALTLTALATFAVLVVGNIFSTLFLCGLGFCPEAPPGYVL